MKKRPLLYLVVLVLIIGAGCTGTTPPDETPSDETRNAAIDNVEYAEQTHQGFQNRHQNISTEISNAHSRGVNTTSASTELVEAATEIRSVEQHIVSAKSYLELGDDERALNSSKQAIKQTERANQSLNEAVTELELAYEVAIQDAELQLQTANREYQTAVIYIESANRAGGSTEDLEVQATKTRDQLQSGVDAVTSPRPNPGQARQDAADVTRMSRKIQTAATTSAKRGIAEAEIQALSDRVSDPLANDRLEAAREAAARAQFEQVEHELLLAQHAEQVAQYEQFVQTVERQDGVTLLSVQAHAQRARETIRDGELPERELEDLNSEVENTRRCLLSMRGAQNEILKTEHASTWLVKADTTAASQKVSTAGQALSNGEYTASCENAALAQELAIEERSRVQQKINSNAFVRVTDFLHDTLQQVGLTGSPDPESVSMDVPSPDEIEVHHTEITYNPPSNPDIKPLDFSNVQIPKIDVPPRQVGDQPSQQQEVDFELEVENPEYCGSTCRFATGTITNVGTEPAHDVTVTLEVYTGGELIWPNDPSEGTRSLGTLKPGEERTLSERIDVTIGDGVKARSNGQVEIRFIIESEEYTKTINETRTL
ncbi:MULTISPECIES: hypothetical protein [Haloferax]|uniref:CARDB domain-containing protein n=1 Tax=Haloferax marinum TaxID=2666143 RepID=A0A6A8G8P7_9EURY|nr:MULTISPECIES: hypothetical protein [Haloferax]KAB1198174.1 hypothetical protein Hfx1150_11870 [Haloferax sp. CBA1150]MRW97257.1 hypothetical protein [Haloferax marinum]